MIWPLGKGCQTVTVWTPIQRDTGRGWYFGAAGTVARRLVLSMSGRRSRAGTGCRPRLRTNTPMEYAGIALRRRPRRCYPLRALGAGTFAGDPHAGLGSGMAASHPAPDARRRTLRGPGFPDPERDRYRAFIDRHRIYRSPSNEWTRSKSGEPPSVSSRSPCRPRTTRRGCATRSSSTSTSSGSGSPSRTGSRRIGWRPATGR